MYIVSSRISNLIVGNSSVLPSYFLCIGLFSPITTIGCNVKNYYFQRQNPPKIASWPGFLASGKDSRTKVVLARILGKQGHGSTPDLAVSEDNEVSIVDEIAGPSVPKV